MNYILLLLFLSYLPQIPHADLTEPSDDAQQVREVITTLFDGMEKADGDRVESVLTDGATLQTVEDSDGEPGLKSTEIADFIEMVRSAEPGLLNERVLYISVNVDGDLATAWMDYHFYRGEEFSHCGVNTMNLIRKNDGWKIFSIIDTRRKQGCM